jgi:membrane fusion protein, multidrug efflux system
MNLDENMSQDAVAGRRRRVWIIGAVVILAAVAARTIPPSRASAPATKKAPTTVSTAVVEKADMPVSLNALGTVTPEYSVAVKTQIAGYLTQISYREGQLVHAGDFLAQIDPRPYKLAEQQAAGQLRKDQALLRAAQTDLVRYRTLLEQDSIAKQQVDTQEALVEQYQGTVETDQAQVGTGKLNLTYCHIVAPITGRVGLRLVDPGNYVQPTDAGGIVVVTQLQPITVIFTLPEDDVSSVMRRLHHGSALPVELFNRNGTARLAQGELSTVDNQIDTATGTVKLRAEFANQDETLFPNQFVNVQLLVDQLHDATVVPGAAVQRGAPGTYVYIVKTDETVSMRPITVGAATADKVAVLAGLAPGDRVVIDGIDKLRDGMSVTLAAAPGKPPAAR